VLWWRNRRRQALLTNLSYSQWHKRRTPIYAQMLPKHPGRSLWSYMWKQTNNTTHLWLFYGHTKRHCHSDKKKPYRHWTNNKDTLLLSACEKNQAQCKISAMTFISKKKRTNYFTIFILYKLFTCTKWWRKTVCHMYILNLVKVWLYS
jgi:hypothetical protein